MQSWSTAGRSRALPFGSWADDLAQAFVRLEPRRTADAPFRGRIAKANAGRIDISRVEASGHKVVRLAEHIRRSTADICFVNLQIGGFGQTGQGGRERQSRPDDLTVVDTTRPYEIAHTETFSLHSIAVPRADVPRGLRERGGLRLSATQDGRRVARLLHGYAEMALAARPDDGATPMLGAHILDLLSYADGIDSARPERRLAADTRRAMIADFVQQNLTDPNLSAHVVARAFGISTRYLHKLFAATDTTFSGFVNDHRLDRAAALLALPNDGNRTILQIALEAGFGDLSHFNRRFKRRFGETPRAFRQRAHRTPGSP